VPARDRWHQRDQRLRRQTGHIQKLQQRLQLGHPAVGRTDAERTALRRQERDNVGRGEVLDPARPRSHAAAGPSGPASRNARPWPRPNLDPQQATDGNALPAPRPATPVRVTRQAPLRISDSRAADPNLARPARIAFRLAARDAELRDHAPIHPAGRNVPAVHPSAQIACNRQHVLDGLRGVAPPHQPRSVFAARVPAPAAGDRRRDREQPGPRLAG
jgi:hypothetical protein